MKFTGKVVLVTGGSSGIGAATSVHFSKLGADLVITGRNEDNLRTVAGKCIGPKPLLIQADVTKEDDVRSIVERTISHFGKLDVLVNSAGIIESGGIEETDLEQFDRVFGVNVRAMYLLTMLAVPHLTKTKGNVVNVSSVTGIRAFPNLLSYCMSKSAVDQFTQCTALELASKGVRVNAVNPGVIVTELHKRGGMSEGRYQEFLDNCKKTHALGRPGTVDEVAKAITFLASDDASFMTGNLTPVDGGRHCMCPR